MLASRQLLPEPSPSHPPYRNADWVVNGEIAL